MLWESTDVTWIGSGIYMSLKTVKTVIVGNGRVGSLGVLITYMYTGCLSSRIHTNSDSLVAVNYEWIEQPEMWIKMLWTLTAGGEDQNNFLNYCPMYYCMIVLCTIVLLCTIDVQWRHRCRLFLVGSKTNMKNDTSIVKKLGAKGPPSIYKERVPRLHYNRLEV